MASRAERIEEAARALLACLDRHVAGLAGQFGDLDLAADAFRAALELPSDAPAQPAPEVAGEAGDSDDGGNCRAHGAPVCEPCAFDRGYAAGLCKNAEAQPHPTPRAEAASAEAVRDACVAAVDREAGALEALIDESDDLPRWQAQKMPVVKKLREVASMLRSLPLPASASAEAVAREAACSPDVDALARELWDIVEQHPGWSGQPIKPRKWSECEPWFAPIQRDMASHVLSLVREAATHAATLGYQDGYLHGWDTRGDERKNPREAGRDKAIADSADRAVAHALRVKGAR